MVVRRTFWLMKVVPTWKRFEKRCSRISRKDRIRNVTIREQIGLEETIIKETEQNQLTWYGHVQRMAEERLSKIALKWMPKQKRARGRPKKNWVEGIKKAMNERNLNEGKWEDRKQWSLGVGQRRKTFWTRYIHTSSHIADLSTADPSWTCLGLKPGLRSEKLLTESWREL